MRQDPLSNPPSATVHIWLGAVLVGGQSTRFGRPKWSEPLAGVPMAQRAAAALAPHAREVVLVGAGADAGGLGLLLLPDAPGGAGPLAGLVGALERAERAGDRGCLMVACDLPLVDADLVGLLLEAWDGEDLVAPERGGRLQPLCAAWSVTALPTARKALVSADRSVAGVVRELALKVLPEAVWRAGASGVDRLLNVNTPADLARAVDELAGRGSFEPRPGYPLR